MQENELVGTWDASQLNVIIGVLPITGLSDGDSVVARRNEALYAKRVGMKGAVARARVTDKTGQIEVHILQTSAANAAISAMTNLDSLTVDGKAVFPITIVDLSGSTVISAGQAWLMQIGDVTFSTNSVAERVYTFECADLKMVLGGNAP